jgi:hypothetical protein
MYQGNNCQLRTNSTSTKPMLSKPHAISDQCWKNQTQSKPMLQCQRLVPEDDKACPNTTFSCLCYHWLLTVRLRIGQQDSHT